MGKLELEEMAAALARALRPHLAKSDVLRSAVELLAQALTDELSRASRPTDKVLAEVPPGDAVDASAEEPEAPFSESDSDEPDERLLEAHASTPTEAAAVPLTLGHASVHVQVQGSASEIEQARQAAADQKGAEADGARLHPSERWQIDLALVQTRSKLKAASCRLLIERRSAEGDPQAEYLARERTRRMQAEAKVLPNCILWAFHPEREPPSDVSMAMIAEAYEAQAEAVELMRAVDAAAGAVSLQDESDALHLLAEANSALRAALSMTWLTLDDGDQYSVHVWLRRETAVRQVYIDRHMTENDPADPSQCPDLRRRLRDLKERVDGRLNRAKQINNAIGCVRYHARLVVKHEGNDSAQHWVKISDAVRELNNLGIAPSDRRVSEALGVDAAQYCPENVSQPTLMATAISSAKLVAAPNQQSPGSGTNVERRWSAEVSKVRALLKGRRMVVLGGEPSASACERLKDAFDLADVEWVGLTEHGSGDPMRSPIQREDTALVVVIIKLAGHLHTEEAKQMAKRVGRPCVLLTGGYNPENIARAVLNQASDRLRDQSSGN